MRKSLKIMNYKFNQARSTNRIVSQNLIRVGACSRPWGEGAESGDNNNNNNNKVYFKYCDTSDTDYHSQYIQYIH